MLTTKTFSQEAFFPFIFFRFLAQVISPRDALCMYCVKLQLFISDYLPIPFLLYLSFCTHTCFTCTNYSVIVNHSCDLIPDRKPLSKKDLFSLWLLRAMSIGSLFLGSFVRYSIMPVEACGGRGCLLLGRHRQRATKGLQLKCNLQNLPAFSQWIPCPKFSIMCQNITSKQRKDVRHMSM